MTQEEMERAMGFMVEQQARFSTDIQKINETLAKHSEALVGLIGLQGKALETLERVAAMHEGIEGRVATLETKMAELAEAEKRTDERLDTLITFVEKYITGGNGRGGRRPKRRSK